MSNDVTQPGTTGRKPRGGEAVRAPSLETPSTADPAVPAGSDPVIAAGAAPTAAAQVDAAEGDTLIVSGGVGAAAKALGLDPNTRVVDVDPGVGANKRAVEAEGFRTIPVETADTVALSAAERAELEELRRMRAGLPSSRTELETLRAARAAVAVAAVAPIGEVRLAIAATKILRGGRAYGPDDDVPVDLEGYAELREIGAILAEPWERLPLADEA